ncbi:MAG: restriction endonuclease [Cyanobacteria bacterium P01_C01_bin.89]
MKEAKTGRKRIGELLRVVFQILKESEDPIQASQVINRVIERVEVTNYETGSYPSGGRRIDKMIRFATVDCVKAGWILKEKGKWSLTDIGQTAYEKYTDPFTFYSEAVRLYQAWKKRRQSLESDSPEEIDNLDDDEIAINFEQAQELADTEIRQYLQVLDPYEFQGLVASLLRSMGYFVSWISPPGKDGGVDILAHSDPLGTETPRIKVQVKRYGEANKISVEPVRSFMALLGDDDVGIFVTTSSFTKAALDEARLQEKRKITLVDLDRFIDLWIENYGRLSDKARRQFPLQPIYFLSPKN